MTEEYHDDSPNRPLKSMWPSVEQQMRISTLCRAKASALDPDDEFTWLVLTMGAEAETRGRWMASVSGCVTHIRIPRA
jgi:hypothetical protein